MCRSTLQLNSSDHRFLPLEFHDDSRWRVPINRAEVNWITAEGRTGKLATAASPFATQGANRTWKIESLAHQAHRQKWVPRSKLEAISIPRWSLDSNWWRTQRQKIQNVTKLAIPAKFLYTKNKVVCFRGQKELCPIYFLLVLFWHYCPRNVPHWCDNVWSRIFRATLGDSPQGGRD